ncbi:MAG TPA: c-type cytochrome [Trueperaceae bacterium]
MRNVIATIATTLALTLLLTSARQAAEATVKVAHIDSGNYLTDGQGMSLYMYLRDGPGVSNCYDQCVKNWPPFTVQGQPVAGQGVVAGLLGVIERKDGSKQVTYNGWPLYYHARDVKPGDTIGHLLGDVFYLVSPSGVRIEEPVNPELAVAADTPKEKTEEAQAPTGNAEAAEVQENPGSARRAAPPTTQGEKLFLTNCSVCHGRQGQGVVGPGLAGNRALARSSYVVTTILFGRPAHGMPSFADKLSNEEIAAVATYVRNAWSNDFGPVSPQEVSEKR